MDFRLSQEQELLRDSARRYFATDGNFENSRRRGPLASAYDWSRFAELGWLAMLVPEDLGGLGARLGDIAILCEEMGRGLTRASFVGGAILPTRIITRCASHEHCRTIMSAIAEGSMPLALAAYEPGRRYELIPNTRAVAMPDGSYRLSGLRAWSRAAGRPIT